MNTIRRKHLVVISPPGLNCSVKLVLTQSKDTQSRCLTPYTRQPAPLEAETGCGTSEQPYGGQRSFSTIPPFLVTALQQGSDVRRRPQAQTISYPLQGHGYLPPQTRGDPDLLR